MLRLSPPLQGAAALLLLYVATAALWVASYVSPLDGSEIAWSRGRLSLSNYSFNPLYGSSRLLADPDSRRATPLNRLGFDAFGDGYTWAVCFPIWFILVAACPLWLLCIAAELRRRERRRRRAAGLCTRCGYDLTLVPSSHCPECGKYLSVRRP